MSRHEHRRPKAPYCWQEKNNTRHIRSLFKNGAIKKSEGRNILDVFRAITEMLSDNTDGTDLTGTNLAKRLGGYALMGTSTVKRTLALMEEQKIISITKQRDSESGQYEATQIELIAPPERGLEVELSASEPNPTSGRKTSAGSTHGGNADPHIEEQYKPIEETQPKEEGRKETQSRVLKTRAKKNILEPKRSPEEFHQAVEQIITHLGAQTGRPCYPHAQNTSDLRARLLEGAHVDDCLLLVDHRVALWFKDTRMTGYLRPETLFARRHFNNYLQLAKEWERNGRPEVQPRGHTLNETGHRNADNVAATGDRREALLEQWQNMSK